MRYRQQVTDDNIIHHRRDAIYMVVPRGIFKNCCFPTAKMVMYQPYVMRIFPLFFSRNDYVVSDSLLFNP